MSTPEGETIRVFLRWFPLAAEPALEALAVLEQRAARHEERVAVLEGRLADVEGERDRLRAILYPPTHPPGYAASDEDEHPVNDLHYHEDPGTRA